MYTATLAYGTGIDMIKKIFKELLSTLLYLLDILVFKDEKLFISASSHGEYLFGGPRGLFNYINQRKTDYNCFYLVKDKSKVDKEGKIIYLYSLLGFWLYLRARYVLFTHGRVDYYLSNSRFSHRKVIVQFWHGVPLKCIGFAQKNGISKEEERDKIGENKATSLFITSSEREKGDIHRCFAIDEEKIIISGRPSIDVLINNQMGNPAGLNPDKTNILYAPTYRPDGNCQFFPFDDFDEKDFSDFLNINKVCLYLRAHKNELSNELQTDSDTIRFFPFNEFPDINEYLSSFHSLITDYSGIFIDYLILNRPVSFILYDLDQYKMKPGLLHDDFEEMLPGDQIQSYDDLKKSIMRVVKKEDTFKSKRDDFSRIYNKGIGNDSSERVFNYLLKYE